MGGLSKTARTIQIASQTVTEDGITKKCTLVADRAFPDAKSLGRNRVILVVRQKNRMDTDAFINDAITLGSRRGLDSLTSNQRVVFLISEAEALCDMEGIDTFLDRYEPEWIAETASAFEYIGAMQIALAFRELTTLPSNREATLDRLNTMITNRTGYNYDSIATAIQGTFERGET